MRRTMLAISTAACAALLAGCGGGQAATSQRTATYSPEPLVDPEQSSAAAASSSAAAAAASSYEAAASASEAASKVLGKPVTSGGVTVTVTAAKVVPTIAMNESNYAPGSPYAKFTAEPPPSGAEWVEVTAHIANNTQVGMDLTCGYPVENKLVNAQGQQYDAIESLYKLKGNPECNKNLQPGFQSDMNYVYQVPTGAQIAGWAFADGTNVSNLQDYTLIHLTVS